MKHSRIFVFSEYLRKIDAGNSVVSCNYVKLQQFQRIFSKLAGKGEYYHSRKCFIQLSDTQELGNVCVYVVKTTDIVIKGKNVVQESLYLS